MGPTEEGGGVDGGGGRGFGGILAGNGGCEEGEREGEMRVEKEPSSCVEREEIGRRRRRRRREGGRKIRMEPSGTHF